MEKLAPEDPQHIGTYRLLARLGSGGMGQVFLARSDRGRTVAVRLIRRGLAEQASFRNGLRQEVAAARGVDGTWAVPMLDADTEAEIPWVVTGYVAGPTLQSVVSGAGSGHGPLPEVSVRALASGIAHALQDIHAAGLVHRDLKPSNVLVTEEGPRVIDFGIARALDAATDGGFGLAGAMVGSPGFMSPEQVRGERVTAAADVFSLGSVLTYAALGRLPFGATDSSAHALLLRITREEPDTAGLPESLTQLVRDCLRKDPAARPTPQAILTRVGDIGTGPGTEPWLPGGLLAEVGQHTVRLAGRTPRSNPAGTAGGGLAGLAGAAAAGGTDPGQATGPGSAAGPATQQFWPVRPDQPQLPSSPSPSRQAQPPQNQSTQSPAQSAAAQSAAGQQYQQSQSPAAQAWPPLGPQAYGQTGQPTPPQLPQALAHPEPTPTRTPPPTASLPHQGPGQGQPPVQPTAPMPTPTLPPPHTSNAPAQTYGYGQGDGYGYPQQAGPAAPQAGGQQPGYGYPQQAGQAGQAGGPGPGYGYPPQAGGLTGPQTGPQQGGSGYGYPQAPTSAYAADEAGGILPPAPFAAAYGEDPGYDPEEPERRSRRGTVLLIAVAVVVALGAGGAVYSFMGSGNQKDDKAANTVGASPSPPSQDSAAPPGSPTDSTSASPSTSPSTSPSPSAKGDVPKGFVGTWNGGVNTSAGFSPRRLVIKQGKVGETVLVLTADGPTGGAHGYHCEFTAALAGDPGAGSTLRIGPSTVSVGKPMSSCTPGTPTTLTIQQDGSLRRVTTDGQALTYKKAS